ncbi:MAG: DUF2130 domain-containing protein [Patescibacteria group bacterium]|nr:DUF2130 domain-containing protein [Patescibacteria group bacterium]
MANTIKCKNCGQEIEISEALTHQIEERLLIEIRKKHQEEIESIKKSSEEIARKKIENELEIERKNREEENRELKAKNQEMSAQILDLMKQLRQMQEADQKRALEQERKLHEEIKRAQEEALKIAADKSQGEIMELKKQLEDTQKALREAQYKASQTSQQLRGEVLELDLEKALRDTFPIDDITPVAKGKQGADISQVVKGRSGRIAGVILWEVKRAKWDKKWLSKLREDGRKAEASAAILVCDKLPKQIKHFEIKDGVLITSYEYALSLASVIRRSILQIAVAKQTAANKDEKLESLYEYLQSEAFRHRFEAFAEGIHEMHENLEREKTAMEKIWKAREQQIKKLALNASRMYGELQGVMGSALPDIKTFALGDGID